MATNSDHTIPFNNINNYLPEVYRSEVNKSMFDVAFNRHLTKDDTARVAGFIGQGNPQALVDRQIKESTPHRQAFQLAPTMFSTVGTVENALSYKAFQEQLALMGVDINRLPLWANTLQFNWAPPVNMDMLINYQDYFWKPENARDPAQYFTIENRCNKAQSKAQSYANMIALRGGTFPVQAIGYATDTFVISSKQDDLFIAGFAFYTDGNVDVNVANKRWVVASSTYDSTTNKTTVAVVESIASAGSTPPAVPFLGQWWYDTTASILKSWSGTAWVATVQAIAVNIDLTQQLNEYQAEANCVCNGTYGWDIGQWDAGEGIEWDTSAGCTPQVLNQWSSQNAWIHKSQVQSFSDVKRAQVPIIEYNSTIEQNEWTSFTYAWKYRSTVDAAFASATVVPSRFELEPIKGYYVTNIGGVWTLYLFQQTATVNRDTDYSQTFVPGFKFRFTDDTLASAVYTVAASEYRQVTISDPSLVQTAVGLGYLCTVVALAESTFTSTPSGGGLEYARIEPLLTAAGDIWRGYHVHWVLDQTSTVGVPSRNCSWNYFLTQDLVNPPPLVAVSSLPVHADNGLTFVPQTTSIQIGNAFQEQNIDITGVTQIDLVDQFRYNLATSQLYATPGSNELRVYVNGIRQYANYTEIVGVGVPSYTVVGTTRQTTQTIPYVQSIVFQTPLAQFDIVRLEVGPAAQADAGMYAIPVRTIEDETAFTLATVAGTQPAYLSLTKYHKLEQTKTLINQYPQFNVYDVVTSDVIAANPLFAFNESSSSSVNPAVGRRIVASTDGKEYEFQQYLLDRDDNVIYGYRNTFTPQSFWYSPLLNTVQYWDGKAWTQNIPVTVGAGIAFRRPVISALPPASLLNVEHSFWMDTTNNVLYQRNASAWVPVSDLVINDTDPTLQTVWKHGLTNQQYVPSYVDASRNPVTVGSELGDWEVLDQWQYNPEHENKQIVKFSQILTHFRSILSGQTAIPGLLGGGAYTLTQNDVGYGVGGTIKEHNDGFDTLISAVNVTNVTPVGVIEFAAREYASGLLSIRDIFNKTITTTFATYTPESLLDFGAFLSESVISEYETNDFEAQTYGDTVAYDPTTGKGIQNWIATAPMLGLATLYRPHLTNDNGDVRLFHHDGHRSQIYYSAAEADKLSRIICGITDSRVSNGKFGVVSTAAAPTTANAIAAFGSLRTGVYWYRVSGGVRKLQRFSPYAINGVAPSFYDASGAEIADGTMYYNFTTQATYKKSSFTWVAVTTPGSGDISPLWTTVNFAELLGAVQLEVETRLYEVTPVSASVFDYSTLTPTQSEQTTYNNLSRSRFTAFLAASEQSSPYVNTAYTATNAFTWNYAASTPVLGPRNDITPAFASSWQEVYTRWYGTPYPNLEPWKLQGYHDKPTWWDDEYLDTTGARKWKYVHSTTTGMWQNVRLGIVPAGRTYPNGAISTGNPVTDGQALPHYAYFSVNISDGGIPGGYAPDALLPPYYDNASLALANPTVRSIFNNYGVEIVAPDADYAFGDVGPVEWSWTVSGQHPYDQPVIAFLMQPARFLHAAFGPRYTVVDGLQVETTFKQVYSHVDTLFHGDVYDTDKVYLVRGINQWYVNFNRFSGFDTNTQFREMWAGWSPRLTYQFGGIVDTSTFEIANKYFDVINQDYQITLANNGVIRDMWLDGFEVTLLNIPPPLVQYNNQAQWKMEVDSLAAVAREISYYGIRSYQFTADPTTDVGTAFRYPIVVANAAARQFGISGDYTSTFTAGSTLTVVGSSTNNGTYTVTSSVFETTTNRTRINVQQAIATSAADGTVNVAKSLPWQTGDMVVIGSAKFLPAPLLPNTPYYVIRITGNTFKLAATPNDAILGNAIDLTSAGEGNLTISQVDTSFYVYGGNGNTQDLWFHYVVDRTDVQKFSPPYTVLGMQSLINLFDGYAAYQADQGILQGVADARDFDPETGRIADWSVETERFINWAYGLRQSRITISDTFPVTANPTTSLLTFGAAVPQWLSGTVVTVSSSGDLPAPLIGNTPYYIVNVSTGVFRLSISANPNDSSSFVTLSTAGSGQVMVGLYNKNRAYPRFEMNPQRNGAWIDTPLGVLSNVIEGPYSDIRIQQTIYDQYARPLNADKITVYRQDKRSQIAIRPAITNDVDPIYVDDPYNYIHVGGAHLFVEGYEHFLIFNDYTVDGSLIYDPFLGLQSQKFDVDYFEKADYTLRPTLGGYYLLDQQFNRNIEGSTGDIRNFYDTMELSETSEFARRSRALLGYTGKSSFLDFLNINSKSQFLFYRGMIQTKGSVNSVKAYINSRRFIDAQMDEFWAYKIAEYGDSRPRVYPEINMFSTDGALDDVRLEFLATSELPTDDDVVAAVNKGFQPVSWNDGTRWNNFPEQKAEIGSPLFLDASVSSMTLIHSGVNPPPPGAERTITFWFNPTTNQLFGYNSTTGLWTVDQSARVTVQPVLVDGLAATDCVYFKLDQPCDDVRVLHRILAKTDTPIVSATSTTIVLAGNETNNVQVGVPFAITQSDSNNGSYYPTAVVYDGTNTTITVVSVPSTTAPLGFVTTEDFGNYVTEFYDAGSGVKEVTKVDSEIIRFNKLGFQDVLIIFALNPAKTKLSPAKLIDNVANTVVQQIPIWDPARGSHSHVAIHNVDLQHAGDPARYEFTANPTNASLNFWNQQEVGTVWLDTAALGYLPYYDDKVFPDVNARLYNWGKLAPWADVKVYEWVKSSVPPSQWDALVTSQSTNSLIAQNNKATGTPRKNVFKRVRTSHAATINTTTNEVTTSVSFTQGDRVLFTAATLPVGIDSGVPYVVANTGTTFTLLDPSTEEPVVITTAGASVMVVPGFVATDWVSQSMLRDRVLAPLMVASLRATASVTATITWPYNVSTATGLQRYVWTPSNPSAWVLTGTGADTVDVYVNGVLVETGLPITQDGSQFYVTAANPVVLNEYDIIDIIRPVHTITTAEAAFNPDVVDDGTQMIQWKSDYEYSTTTFTYGGANTGATTVTNYYFWVEGSTTRDVTDSSSLSAFEVAQQLVAIPTPYFIVQRPKDDPYLMEKYGYGMIEYGSIFSLGILTEADYQVPVLYREAIIRKVASYINDDNRYFVRFTRDWALRDDPAANGKQMNLKNKHQEWLMFRRDQTSTIARVLWDRLVESLIGYKLTDSSIRVPSLERELYDAALGTDTRFGLGIDQAFVDKQLGLATVLAYLTNPLNDFSPTDIDAFFATHSFDTPANIAVAMDTIYTTFNALHVNAIWFEALSDALSTRAKYKELLKTSWIALHGIRVLEVGGLFDD